MGVVIRILLLSILVIFASCATVSLPIDQLNVVPPERIQWVKPNSDDLGKIVVARDSGFNMGGAQALIDIDGIRAATVYSSEVLSVPIISGRHTVTVTVNTPTGSNLFRPRSLVVGVKPNETSIVRIGFDDGGSGVSIWQAKE